MAQVLTYAANQCIVLGRPGWHRKYVFITGFVIAFGLSELGLRLVVAASAPVSSTATSLSARVVLMYSRSPVLLDSRTLYTGALAICGCVAIMLLVRVLRACGQGSIRQLDARERVRLQCVRVLLCLATIVAVAGYVVPAAHPKVAYPSRWLYFSEL